MTTRVAPTRTRAAVRDYARIANEYVADVLEGRRLACHWVRQACERQRRDLERAAAGEFPYTFDPERAAAVCAFVEALPHVKGRYAGTITLEPWQVFILTTVFGWVDADGFRRFRTAYIEVPRKNGKSSLTSGVLLYLLSADGEPGAEVYSAATTRDQAKIVWQDAKRMVEKSPGLRSALGVQTSAHAIFQADTGSTFKALSRDQQGNLDGLNVHAAGVDELHGHKDRGVWDVLETATGARRQSLIWAITTAGSNRAGICYEQRSYVTRILDGVHQDETYFGIVYTLDAEDDPFDERSWEKANPNYGVSVSPEDLRRKALKAQQMAAATNNFLTKHLDIWVNADTAWMNMQAWDACADESLDPDDFVGTPCVESADLATKTDMVARVRLHWRDVDGVRHYYAFGRYYLPEDAVEDGRNSQYSGWAREGRLTVTDGATTDFEVIEDDIRLDAEKWKPKDLSFDPWQATQMMQRLAAEGLPVSEYRPVLKNMSEPMKELEALVLAGRFHHDGCPILTWMISNVVAHSNSNDDIMPRKEFPENKIDGAVALIAALGRAITLDEPDEPEYRIYGLGPKR